MPLLFMDTGCEPENQDSFSADECSSNTSGLDREGEEQQRGPKVTKRREKNRDAARKSRKKQTERADELHQELQRLEQSNSALQKEIAALRKDQQLYETALERHKPQCRLRSSTSRSPASSAQHQASSSPNSASPSQAKSASPSIAPQTLNRTKETDRSPSAAALTTSTTAASSAELSSSPSTFPYSVSFSSQTAPHSLFSQLPLTTLRSANVGPSCAGLLSNPAPFTAAQLQPDKIPPNKTSSVSQTFHFSRNAFLAASPNLQASHSPLAAESTSVPEQCRSTNSLQLPPYLLSGNPNNSRLSCALLPTPLPDPAPLTLSTSPYVCSEPPPALSYDHQVVTSSASILSLLTVPSPLNGAQTTSSSTDECPPQPLPSRPPAAAAQLDPFKDLSLSEFLERNDWILNGMIDE